MQNNLRTKKVKKKSKVVHNIITPAVNPKETMEIKVSYDIKNLIHMMTISNQKIPKNFGFRYNPKWNNVNLKKPNKYY